MDKRSAGRRYHGQFKRPFRERERPDRRDCNAGGNHAGELEPRRILPHTAAFRNGCLADCRTGAYLCHVL